MRQFLLLLFTIGLTLSLSAQDKFHQSYQTTNTSQKTVKPALIQDNLKYFKYNKDYTYPSESVDASVSIDLDISKIDRPLKKTYDPESGELMALHGSFSSIKKLKSHADRCHAYLEKTKSLWNITSVEKELKPIETTVDKNGGIHTKIDQYHQGVKVYGGELTIHEKDGNIYMLQGKTKTISKRVNTDAAIDRNEAKRIASSSSEHFLELQPRIKSLMQNDQIQNELILYPHNGSYSLAYYTDILVHLGHREVMIIDAHTGDVIDQFANICKVHNHDHQPLMDGKLKSSGVALGGNRREIDIYQCGPEYLLLDASRPMYRGNENCADADGLINGVIITLDAGNTNPGKENFDYVIGNSSSVDQWQDPSAVSAHINGGVAYEYFRRAFGRNSITGNGTNIVSFVNVAETNGRGMDNAFWNGEFIFYGNGDQAFSPLAGGLDVAGHEMAHGVIQTTANLEYRNESGALNEHYADVFGVLIEDEDFRIGEDVVNREVFRTGTMRDMGDPNNGGTQLGDVGYQPANVSEQFRGSEDNGGVHINSGIPNLAFFTFVTDESYGTDINNRARIAEQIWYKALTQYLRSTSNFSDMRVAVVQAARDDYGADVVAALESAFDAVGITLANVTEETPDLESNPGEEYVVWSDINLGTVKISRGDGTDFGDISITSHISRPSVTDNGQFVVFVNAERNIQVVEIDWSVPEVTRDFEITESGDYRNAAISRDGRLLAALTGNLAEGVFTNEIIIFDLADGGSQSYELFNPTFSENNTATEGVRFADVIEFDHSGENILYDAFNELSGALGNDLSYWDIGIINVWNNAENRFTLGNIFKLFNGLPEDVSVGNPTFSKNNSSIIALDFIEQGEEEGTTEYSILGVNRESGDVGLIFENNKLGYPSYSLEDDQIIFSVENQGKDIIAITDVNDDKISASGDVFIFTEDAEWGVFLGNGERNLTTATEEEILLDNAMNIYPNPFDQSITIEISSENLPHAHVLLYNQMGQLIEKYEMKDQLEISTRQLLPGTYLIRYSDGKSNVYRRVVKM